MDQEVFMIPIQLYFVFLEVPRSLFLFSLHQILWHDSLVVKMSWGIRKRTESREIGEQTAVVETNGDAWTSQVSRAGWHVFTPAIAQVSGEGVEALPGCGKKAWGDGDTGKEARTQSFSLVRLFAAPRTIAHQAPLSMRFSRQKYQSGLPFPPPGDTPSTGIKPASPELAGGFLTTEHLGSPLSVINHSLLAAGWLDLAKAGQSIQIWWLWQPLFISVFQYLTYHLCL